MQISRREGLLGFACLAFAWLQSCETLKQSPSQGALNWHQIPSPTELGRPAHSLCASVDNSFFVFGGIDDESDSPYNNRLGLFHVRDNVWQISQSAQGPVPLNLSSLGQFKDGIVIFGGETSRQPETNDAYIYVLSESKWEKISKGKVSPRKQASVVRVGEKLAIIGGKSRKDFNDWGLVDPSSKTLSAQELEGVKSRVSHVAMAISNSEAFVWGGFVGTERRSDGFILSTDSNTVDTIPSTPLLSARANARAIRFENKIYIWGGTPQDGNSNSGAIFDIETRIWTSIPPIPDSKFNTIKSAEIVRYRDKGFYLIGGRFGLENFNDELWFYDRFKNKWLKRDTWQQFPGRMAHCVVAMDDGKILVFGGIGYVKGTKILTHLDGLWVLEGGD